MPDYISNALDNLVIDENETPNELTGSELYINAIKNSIYAENISAYFSLVDEADKLTFSYYFKLSKDKNYVETILFEISSSEHSGLVGVRVKLDFYNYNCTNVVMPE